MQGLICKSGSNYDNGECCNSIDIAAPFARKPYEKAASPVSTPFSYSDSYHVTACDHQWPLNSVFWDNV